MIDSIDTSICANQWERTKIQQTKSIEMNSFDELLTNSELNIAITANKRQVCVLFRLGICLVDFMSGFLFFVIYIEHQLVKFSITISTSNLSRVIFHLLVFYTSKNDSGKD